MHTQTPDALHRAFGICRARAVVCNCASSARTARIPYRRDLVIAIAGFNTGFLKISLF